MSEQIQCNCVAVYRYTWAGKGESFCCDAHRKQIENVASAIEYFVQFIPLNHKYEQCRSFVHQQIEIKRKIKFNDFLLLIIGLRDTQKQNALIGRACYTDGTTLGEIETPNEIEKELDEVISKILLNEIKIEI